MKTEKELSARDVESIAYFVAIKAVIESGGRILRTELEEKIENNPKHKILNPDLITNSLIKSGDLEEKIEEVVVVDDKGKKKPGKIAYIQIPEESPELEPA